jgi:hypothetical protein
VGQCHQRWVEIVGKHWFGQLMQPLLENFSRQDGIATICHAALARLDVSTVLVNVLAQRTSAKQIRCKLACRAQVASEAAFKSQHTVLGQERVQIMKHGRSHVCLGVHRHSKHARSSHVEKNERA